MGKDIGLDAKFPHPQNIQLLGLREAQSIQQSSREDMKTSTAISSQVMQTMARTRSLKLTNCRRRRLFVISAATCMLPRTYRCWKMCSIYAGHIMTPYRF